MPEAYRRRALLHCRPSHISKCCLLFRLVPVGSEAEVAPRLRWRGHERVLGLLWHLFFSNHGWQVGEAGLAEDGPLLFGFYKGFSQKLPLLGFSHKV
jgi:hypothetical protein